MANHMCELLFFLMARILLKVTKAYCHRQLSGTDEVPTDLGVLRQRLNIPAAIGVYMQLLDHLDLPVHQLHLHPSQLILAVLDVFEENPLLVMPYIWSCKKDIDSYISAHIRNICDFAQF